MVRTDRAQLINVFSEQAGQYDTAVEYFTPLAAKLIAQVRLEPGQDVLDIGCGRGAVLFQAARAVGGSGSAVGIDIAPGMVAEASAEVARQGLANVTVLQMDGYAPDFRPASFDHVLGSMSIIMIPDLPTALRNYHTLLRNGGTLAFTSPAIDTDPLDWKIGPFHLRRFLAEALPGKTVAELAGMLDAFPQMTPRRMLSDLRGAGFGQVRAIDVTTTVRGSGRELVGWTFTHGTRAFWNLVPEPRQTEYALEWASRIDAEFGGREPAYDTVNRVFLATR